MRQTFKYQEKFSWGFLFLGLVGLAGIIYAFVTPFNIRFKSLTVLAYPTSQYAVIVIGILFIAYTIHKYLKMKAFSGSGNTISIYDNQLIFKTLSGYTLVEKQVTFTDVVELWNKIDDDDGESMIIYTKSAQDRYEFFAENFATAGDFADFKKILEAECINITNRTSNSDTVAV